MIDANKKRIAVLASLFSMLAMAMLSKNVIDAARRALALCAGKIVPSIFPFIVASAVLVSNTQSDTFKFAKGTVRFLFGTSSLSPAAIIPGIVCGYPSGAICTCSPVLGRSYFKIRGGEPDCLFKQFRAALYNRRSGNRYARLCKNRRTAVRHTHFFRNSLRYCAQSLYKTAPHRRHQVLRRQRRPVLPTPCAKAFQPFSKYAALW